MASQSLSESGSGSGKIGVVRLALTGAIASAVFFALCWVGTFLPIGPATHMYLQLFTSAPLTSGAALVQGLCWSAAFGAIAGGLIGFTYNLFGALDRR
jgi:hypothetical protein